MREVLAAAVLAGGLLMGAGRALAEDQDPFLWLEDVSGARAQAWVRAENAKTLGRLEADPRYKGFEADALRIAEARDRIPSPRFLAGAVYNFWQDPDHVRGVWRRTTLADYARPEPRWTTVLDLDAYAKATGGNWVSHGFTCEETRERRCLVNLSDGGEDAVTVREFDLASSAFVPGGFDLPKGKQRASFEGEDSLLIAREWAPGELTASGYPYIVKRLRRGETLDAARELFRGEKSDEVGVETETLVDGSGRRASFVVRGVTFFEFQFGLVDGDQVKVLGLPRKAAIEGMVDGKVLVRVNEPWRSGGVSVPSGAIVAIGLEAMRAHPDALRPTVVFAPGPRQSVEGVSATKTRVVISALDNVRGRAFVLAPTAAGGWTRQAAAVPDNLTVAISDTDVHSDRAFIGITGFLTPTRLELLDARTQKLTPLKALPPKFDASRHEVRQLETTSKDGTRIPYFLVAPKTMKADGSTPTLMTAYGGFQVSETPNYLGATGKIWLERGGAYVLANIRGGGEFGPAWHEAGLKTNRQRIYDDFAAVAEDLFRRGVTSPRRLGIRGGSNGGLLMGVEMTQHPDHWRAVEIAVPLLDMIRFEKIAAGASWVGEYGSVENPAERAFLASISPYQNLKAGAAYPEPFIWTTTKDDRVGPQHARKFAAKMASFGEPYLFYEVTEGGHGAGANLREQAKTTALGLTYFAEKLMD